MSEDLDGALLSMRMKPIQMALLTLGYDHDMAVTDEGMALISRQPGLTVTFKLDPMTMCVMAEFVWHTYLPARKQAEYRRQVNELNQPTFDLQFVLDEADRKNLLVVGREFLFSSAGVTWEQASEFVHYCMTDAASQYVNWCAEAWPKFAPKEVNLQAPEPSQVQFEFDEDQQGEGNPFGLITDPTPAVTLERIYSAFESMGAEELVMGGGFVEYQHMGQRVSAWLHNGVEDNDRLTLAVSSGTGMQVKSKKQLDQLLQLCNQYTKAHVLATVFTEEIENGARLGVFAEARIDVPAGMSDEQLWMFLGNTAKWTAELCLTVRFRLENG